EGRVRTAQMTWACCVCPRTVVADCESSATVRSHWPAPSRTIRFWPHAQHFSADIERRLMSINLTCECGKKLRVNEDKIGKRVKCPGCQAILTVPAPEAEDEPEHPRKPKKAPPPPEPEDEPEPPRKAKSKAKPVDD